MRGLANAAVEGLARLRRRDRSRPSIAASRTSPASPQEHGRGIAAVDRSCPTKRCATSCSVIPAKSIETELRQADGGTIPVELIAAPGRFRGPAASRRSPCATCARARRPRADLRYLAQHDALTGLPNRRSFNSTLDREIASRCRERRHLAVLCLDLDRFKEVNDLFGHAAGDALLQRSPRCTAGVLDDDQMLARLGGDEFAIIAPGLTDPAAAGRIAESILDAFRAENENGARWRPRLEQHRHRDLSQRRHRSREPDEPRRHRALPRQGEGRGTYRFFEAAMGAEVTERRHIEHDLLPRHFARRTAAWSTSRRSSIDDRRGHRLRGAAALAACRRAARSRPTSSSRSPRRAG